MLYIFCVQKRPRVLAQYHIESMIYKLFGLATIKCHEVTRNQQTDDRNVVFLYCVSSCLIRLQCNFSNVNIPFRLCFSFDDHFKL